MNEDRVARSEAASEPSAASRSEPRPSTPSSEVTDRGREPGQSAGRTTVGELSRPCFLSGFAARTVRLPTPEIEQLLIVKTVSESFDRLNDGQSANTDGEHALVEYDRLLGIEPGNHVNTSGFLTQWKLTPEEIKEWVEQEHRSNPIVPVTSKVPGGTHPEETLERCRKGLKESKIRVDWLREIDAGTPSDPNPIWQRLDSLKQRATVSIGSSVDEGKIRQQMESLAWDPGRTRGSHWLEGLVLSGIDYCDAQARIPDAPNQPNPVLEDLEACEAELNTVQGQLRREKESWWGWVRHGWSLARQVKPCHPYTKATADKVARLPHRLVSLQRDLEALIIRKIAEELRRYYFNQMALALATYRKTVLQPLALRLENARDQAQRWQQQAVANLQCWQGSPTTRQLCDDALLAAVDRRFRQLYDGSREVVQALVDRGIVLGRERLTLRNMERFSPERLCEMVRRYIEASSREQRRFLDQGWALPDARRLLMAHLPWLECAMQPLINYDRDGLGERNVRGYLLVPDGLTLSPPLGERLGNLPMKRSADPQCVTVVSFLHGVSTNALRGLERGFAAYRRRLGDHLEAVDPQRFPLHIFRDGQYYDEPYSPVGWRFSDQGLKDLLVLAHLLGLTQDGVVRLPVRTFAADIEALKADPNRAIELGRVVLDAVRLAGRHELVREKLWVAPTLRPLRQTYRAENGTAPNPASTAPGES